MTTMKMTELTEELQSLGIDAHYSMSGGNCATIYLGNYDAEGYYEYAVGAGNYSLDEIHHEEICWGIDGEESAHYFVGNPEDFTPAKVARLIASDYKEERK